MDIIIFVILVMIMMAMGVLAKDFQFVGMIAGLGLLLMAIAIQSSGLEVQTGLNITTDVLTNVTVVSTNYANMFTYYSGITFMKDLLTLVIGGIGALFIVYSVN